MCLVSLLFIIASSATVAYLGYQSFPGGEIGWSSAIICPLIAIVATISAYGLMQKDHNRLKAVDRIR